MCRRPSAGNAVTVISQNFIRKAFIEDREFGTLPSDFVEFVG